MPAPKKKPTQKKKASGARASTAAETCVLGPYDAEPNALPEASTSRPM